MSSSHTEHCRACKQRIAELLKALYGGCRVNHCFGWPSQPQAYQDTAIGGALEQICAGLGQLRGHRDFIKSPTVPPCDYYVPVPSFIVELDESQHFSRPRMISLALYPPSLKVGYPLSRWQQLCRELNAVDDQPFDRDERRAWYDTLRDLVPLARGLSPTVRLYANDHAWCALSSRSVKDRTRFAALLSGGDATPWTPRKR